MAVVMAARPVITACDSGMKAALAGHQLHVVENETAMGVGGW